MSLNEVTGIVTSIMTPNEARQLLGLDDTPPGLLALRRYVRERYLNEHEH